MAGMQRFITYIYAYERGKKQNNTGFAKIEIRGNEGRVEIHLRDAGVRRGEGTAALFLEKNGEIVSFPLGKMRIANGLGDYSTVFKADKIGNSAFSFEKMEGIFIMGDESSLFLSRWKEGSPINVTPEHIQWWAARQEKNEEITEEGKKEDASAGKMESHPKETPSVTESVPLQQEQIQPETESVPLQQEQIQPETESVPLQQEQIQPETESVPSQQEQIQPETESVTSQQEQTQPETESVPPQQEQIQPQRVPRQPMMEEEDIRTTEVPMRNIFPQYNWLDIWDNIKETHPSFQLDEKVCCVRIELKDLRELPKKYWYFGNNSFLLHGFFNYRYLLIGKFEEERWFIGVPGIYQRQERVMAAIFGFPEFLPIHKPEGMEEKKEEEEPVNWFGCWFHTLEE